jgi:hypothetical protein
MNSAKKIAVILLWKNAPLRAKVELLNAGQLDKIEIICGKGEVTDSTLCFPENNQAAVRITVTDPKISAGARATLVKISETENPFSFFLRDALHSEYPIYFPEYGIAVTNGDDKRDFMQVESDINDRSLKSDFDRYEREGEESLSSALKRVSRNKTHPAWLGIPHDMRMFMISHDSLESSTRSGFLSFKGAPSLNMYMARNIAPRPRMYEAPYCVMFFFGQGEAGTAQIENELEEGFLPILHSLSREQDVEYRQIAFVTHEDGPLQADRLYGFGYELMHENASKPDHEYPHNKYTGKLFADIENNAEAKSRFDRNLKALKNASTTICWNRLEAENTGKVPRYAWFKSPTLAHPKDVVLEERFEGSLGMEFFGGNVAAITLVDGKPLPDEEQAILLMPGEKVCFDILVPHNAIPSERAEKLLKWRFEEHIKAARKFWKAKIPRKLSLPDKDIEKIYYSAIVNNMLTAWGNSESICFRAGATYPPIATETIAVSTAFDSMGINDTAEASINTWFNKIQASDGEIKTYLDAETGAALWMAGEHFRYTGNKKWAEKITQRIIKSIEFLHERCRKSRNEENRKTGSYGLLSGRVNDLSRTDHSFFMNAMCYAGLAAAMGIIEHTAPEKAGAYKKELEIYRRNIRDSLYFALGNAPLFPCADGSWAPFISPWPENNGLLTLYADGGKHYTHGSFAGRGVTTGPLWCVISGIIDPEETAAGMMLKTMGQYPVTSECAGLSEPYYYRHDYLMLRRGMHKAFLKMYYNQMAGLIDQETKGFWEHYYGVGQMKTGEEAWFLMQTRWMLYFEEGDCLNLLSMIPRVWLTNNRKIKINGMYSYFGEISLSVDSQLKKGIIRVTFEAKDKERKPARIKIRLPHPEGKKAKSVSSGTYDPEKETVSFENFSGAVSFELYF